MEMIDGYQVQYLQDSYSSIKIAENDTWVHIHIPKNNGNIDFNKKYMSEVEKRIEWILRIYRGEIDTFDTMKLDFEHACSNYIKLRSLQTLLDEYFKKKSTGLTKEDIQKDNSLLNGCSIYQLEKLLKDIRSSKGEKQCQQK